MHEFRPFNPSRQLRSVGVERIGATFVYRSDTFAVDVEHLQ